MSAPTSKQLDRASQIVAACEQLRDGLLSLQGIAFNQSLDGVTLTGADLAATSLAYTTGASLDLVIAAAAQLATVAATTPVTGTQTTIAQAIARVCGS